jgi:hypothetical protein
MGRLAPVREDALMRVAGRQFDADTPATSVVLSIEWSIENV